MLVGVLLKNRCRILWHLHIEFADKVVYNGTIIPLWGHRRTPMEQLKIGVFGLWRGGSFLPIINALDNATVYAVCDKDEGKVAEALKICP